MWLSRQMRRPESAPESLQAATVQTAQERIATDENQTLQLAAPGGFAWRPSVGDRLLVLKGYAVAGGAPCPVALAPGECCLYSQNAYVHLTEDGRIELHGQIVLNGSPLTAP